MLLEGSNGFSLADFRGFLNSQGARVEAKKPQLLLGLLRLAE
jgi:hypothetical protein